MQADRTTDSPSKSLTSLPVIGEVDGRTKPALHFKAAVADIAADLGGADRLSRAELEIVRRAAGLSVLAAQHETAILNSEPVDSEKYIATVNALRRVLVTLGLRRRARDVTPDLHDYISQTAEDAA